MSIIEFLRDYEFQLGDLDTEDGDSVVRDEEAFIVNNDENIQIYRDAGIDAIIEAAADFNLDYIKDEQNNLFAETVFNSTATAYYEILPDVFGPQVAEILILNSGGVEECLNQVDDDDFEGGLSDEARDTLVKCYMNRVFQAIAVAGLARTFPVYSEPGGSIIPIFNVLPKNTPSGQQITFVSAIIPISSSEIFTNVNFTIDSEINQIDRFRFEKENPPKDIEDVFNPKETIEGDGNIDFVFEDKNLTGSAGSVFFKGDIQFNESSLDPYDVTVGFEGGDQTVNTDVEAEIGENAYIVSEASEITLHDFNSTFDLSGGTNPEEATLQFLTIDNSYGEITITGPYSESDADSFIQDWKDKIDEEELKYLDFVNDGGTVKLDGRVAYLGFFSPEGSDSSEADPITAFFNLGVFVFSNDPTIENSNIDNIREIEVVSEAPFFEKENEEWVFITENAAPITSDIQEINVSASAFEPSFSIEDTEPNIVEKSLNAEYDGFGGTVKNYETGQRENAEVPLLEDFFKFYKNYIEDNFKVIHIGITSVGTPTVSSPESLTVDI
jgi:hypothetical protein